MTTIRASRRVLTRIAGLLAITLVLATGSVAVAGAQDTEPDDDHDDVDGDSVDALQDGAYEPCSAYFGFGKELGAQELVAFDVTVEGSHDGSAPAVGDGVEVVLRVELEDATVIDCFPVEVTEDDWTAAYGQYGLANPPFPGPGHYAYPSIRYPDLIGDVAVANVAFRVVEIPDGLHLVSPGEVTVATSVESALVPLAAVFPSFDDLVAVPNPAADAIVLDGAGADALAAWSDAQANCPATSTPDLDAAIQAIIDYTGVASVVPTDPGCLVLMGFSVLGAWSSGAYDAIGYSEAIVLAADPVPPGPPSPDHGGAAPAADAVDAPPRFTG